MALTKEFIVNYGRNLTSNFIGECYLYEPFVVKFTTDDPNVTQLSLTVGTSYTSGAGPVDFFQDYAIYTVDQNGSVEIDLSKVARGVLQREWYKIGKVLDIDTKTVIPETIVSFSMDEVGGTGSIGSFYPWTTVIGGRNYRDLEEMQTGLLPTGETKLLWLTDWDYAGILQPEWIGQPIISCEVVDYVALSPITISTDVRPSVTITTPTEGRCLKDGGAYLIWKSQYGGWNSYGFDILEEDKSLQYLGSINPKQIDWKSGLNQIYVPANYTGIQSSYMAKLKQVGVSTNEAEVLKSLNNSPAIFLKKPGSDSLELMRMTSFSAPFNNLAGGVTVNVILDSISKNTQNSR